MTRTDSPCTPESTNITMRSWFWGILAFVLIISPGCAFLKIPKVEIPTAPLVLLEARKLPDFLDDMNYDALAASLEQSLVYLKTISPETRFSFGADTYSADHMIASLERFELFLQTNPPVNALNRFIREHYRVYQSIGSDQAGRVLFTGYYEPFLKGSFEKANGLDIHSTPAQTTWYPLICHSFPTSSKAKPSGAG